MLTGVKTSAKSFLQVVCSSIFFIIHLNLINHGADNKKAPKYSGALYREINKQWLYRPLGVCIPPPKFIYYLFHLYKYNSKNRICKFFLDLLNEKSSKVSHYSSFSSFRFCCKRHYYS